MIVLYGYKVGEKLLDKQREIIEAVMERRPDGTPRYKIIYVTGGIRSGKTTGVVKAAFLATMHLFKATVWDVAFEYRTLRPHQDELEYLLSLNNIEYTYDAREGPTYFIPELGTRIEFRETSQERRLVAATVDLMIVEEAAAIGPDDEKSRRIFQTLLGRLSPPHSQMILVSSAKGPNWLWQDIVRRKEEENIDFIKVIHMKATENTTLSESYLNMLRVMYAQEWMWRQEVEGEIVTPQGLVFPYNFEEYRLKEMPPLEKFDYIVGGLDWGQTAPSAIVIVGVCRREGAIYILDEFYKPNLSFEELKEKAKELVRKYERKFRILWADPHHKFFNTWRKDGIPIRCTLKVQKVKEGLLKIISYMENKRLWFAPHIKHLIEEMEILQWKDSYNFEIDKKAKDHAIDALRYALFDTPLPSQHIVLPPTPEEDEEKRLTEALMADWAPSFYRIEDFASFDSYPWRH